MTLATVRVLAARLDLGGRLSASVEATWGRAGVHHDPALGLADRTTHQEITAMLRASSRGGAWIGLGAGLARDTDHVVYRPGGTSHGTATVPDLRLSLAFGFPLHR